MKKKIQPEETEVLNQLIKDDWVDCEVIEEFLVTDPVYQIIATFEKLYS